MDFGKGEITTVVKGEKVATMPLHPTLATVLRDHLESRNYESDHLFCNGRDVTSRRGQKAKRQRAWRICKRVRSWAGIEESVHSHRSGRS